MPEPALLLGTWEFPSWDSFSSGREKEGRRRKLVPHYLLHVPSYTHSFMKMPTPGAGFAFASFPQGACRAPHYTTCLYTSQYTPPPSIFHLPTHTLTTSPSFTHTHTPFYTHLIPREEEEDDSRRGGLLWEGRKERTFPVPFPHLHTYDFADSCC